MGKKQLHMIGFSHIDPVWFWDRREGLQEVRATFSSVLERLEENPDFFFTCTSAAFFEFLQEADPPLFRKVRDRVLEGRIELTGGWWVEPDCNLPCGESFVRQGLYGQAYFRKAFGLRARVGGNADSFGHSPMLPQILRGCGMDRYYFMRPRLGSMDKLTGRPDRPLVRWRSPDGSEVTAFSLPAEYTCWFYESVRKNVADTLACLDGYPSLPCFFGVGNHGGGPTVMNIRAVRELREEFPEAELRFSTLERFFDQVEGMDPPVLTAYLEGVNTGCYGVDRPYKQRMRRAEQALLRAERLQAMAVLAGGRGRLEKTEPLWKRLLFCQFHDTLGGTSIRPARDNAMDDMAGVTAQAEHAAHMAVQRLSARLDTRGEGVPILLVNDRAQPWQGMVDMEISWFCKDPLKLRDEDGREIRYQRDKTSCTMLWYNLGGRRRMLFQATVPAFGVRVFRAYAEEPGFLPEPSHEPGELVLENEALRAVFDREGDLCGLTDKKTGYEALGAPIRFQIWHDERDSWGHGKAGRAYGDSGEGFATAEARLTERGVMRRMLRVRKTSPFVRLELVYSLDKGADALRLHARVLWDGPWKSMKLQVTAAGGIASTNAEAPYCRMTRAASATEYFMHRYVDAVDQSGRGVAVVNDGLYSFGQGEGSLDLTLLRSAVFAHGDCVGWENEHDTLEYTDLGEHDCRFLFVPHGAPLSPGRLPDLADDLHAPPVAFVDHCHEGGLKPGKGLSFLEADIPNVRIGAFKTAQDGHGLILRLWETDGAGAETGLRVGTAKHTLRFAPHGIRTLRIAGGKITECGMLEEEG